MSKNFCNCLGKLGYSNSNDVLVNIVRKHYSFYDYESISNLKILKKNWLNYSITISIFSVGNGKQQTWNYGIKFSERRSAKLVLICTISKLVDNISDQAVFIQHHYFQNFLTKLVTKLTYYFLKILIFQNCARTK